MDWSDYPTSLKSLAVHSSIGAGQILFHQGTRPRSVFFVVKGEIRLLRHTHGGQEVILQRSRAGFFAEASLDVPAYHCDAVARVSSTLLCFPIAAFKAALADDPRFHGAWSSHLARELRRMRAQCERLHLKSASDRIVHYIEAEGVDGCLTLNQPKKAWALELGLSHEALYRTLRQLQAAGTILTDGSAIMLQAI